MTDTAHLRTTARTLPDLTDSAALEARLLPLMPALLAYFQRRVDPTEDAGDCLSETLIVLWRHRSRLPQHDDDLRAYGYGIARNVLANHRRGRLRSSNLDQRLRDEFTPIHVDPASIEETDQLLAALKPIDRELVTLVVLDGLGLAEAGAILGLRPGTARTRYARARQRLRTTIDTASH